MEHGLSVRAPQDSKNQIAVGMTALRYCLGIISYIPSNGLHP